MSIYDHDNPAFLSFFASGAALGDAALALASKRIFVLALKPGSKQPATAHGLKDATTNTDKIKALWSQNEGYNIGVHLRMSGIVVVDIDPRNEGHETFEALVEKFGDLPPTFTVRTGGGGFHYYYRVNADYHEQFDYAKNCLGQGIDLLDNGYAVFPPSALEGGGEYKINSGSLVDDFATLPYQWLDKAVAETGYQKAKRFWTPEDENWQVPLGEIDNAMASIAGVFRHQKLNEEELADLLNVLCDHGRFEFGNWEEEIRAKIPRIAKSIGQRPPGEVSIADHIIHIRKRTGKPKLDRTALRGPIGEWVKYIEPVTEAHPAALMMQALVMFGTIIGARTKKDAYPFFEEEDQRHRTSLFSVIIGGSAIAAKGDSFSRAIKFMRTVDPSWNINIGIQTGEAIVAELADQRTVTYGNETEQKSNIDKRYCMYDSEFSRTLAVANRRDSTLKPIMQMAWDSGDLRKVTKGEVHEASGCTLGFMGHITMPMWSHLISYEDMQSGFTNRMFLCYAERTKNMPHAVSLKKSELARLAAPLKDSVIFARESQPGDYEFDEEAEDLWCTLVADQSYEDENENVISQMVRKRPMVRRMAMIYAVAEQSDMIEYQHLRAAMAMWDYHMQTVRFLFSDSVGDPIADKIYKGLLKHSSGLPMGDIYRKILGGNHGAAKVKPAMQRLLDSKLVIMVRTKQKSIHGRSGGEIYIAKQPLQDD